MKIKKSRKSILIGPLPEPYNGLSVCFDLLVNGFQEKNLPYSVVDITSSLERKRSGGQWSWNRAAEYVQILMKYIRMLPGRRKNVYITIAQSKVGFMRDFFMIWIAKILQNEVILHIHGGNYDNFYVNQSHLYQFLIKQTLLQADKIIVLGESLRNMFDFETRLNGRIYVVPNGLPSNVDSGISPKTINRNEPFRILYLSNLIESKGYFDVLESVRILIQQYGRNIECFFCGNFHHYVDDKRVKSNEHATELFNDFVQKHGLEMHVKYLGVVTGSAKIDILKKAHCFVLPTNYINEGQPVSIIEAMAYGCPIITTNYRAIPEMVTKGMNGYFVDYGKGEQIANYIQYLISHPDVYQKMSESSIHTYKEKFTRRVHLDRLIPLVIGDLDNVIGVEIYEPNPTKS